MTTAVQVQYRRGTAAQVAAFTGAQGEMVVDTTNQRVVVQDGSTAGGWPADLATRTAVVNASYSALATDRIVAYTAISAARSVSLPAAAIYPTGTILWVVDESGSCSATNTITVSPNGSDTIEGASGATVAGPYGVLGLESNGVNAWTIVHSRINSSARTTVANAGYSVKATDRMVVYTSLSAAQTVALCASSAYPGGTLLWVCDESGGCSPTNTITISANGTDTINGASSALLDAPYGYLALESNGSGKWTIVDQGPTVLLLNGLTGNVKIAASDGSSITASATTITIGGPGGFVNRFRNGTMDVWQRGTSPGLTVGTSGSAYTADGWMVNWSASSSAAPAVSQASGRLLSKNSLQVTGAANLTDVQIQQRIESLVAAALCSQTVTVQAQVYNNTGAAITPTLTVKHAGSQDSWSSPTTDVNAVSLQSCANGAWTQVAYTFSASASSYNGLQITFDFGNNFGANTKSIALTECDIRVTPGASPGLNGTPPPPELRPVAAELAFSQRYYQTPIGAGTFGSVENSTTILVSISLPVAMRAAPTITLVKTSVAAASYDLAVGATWVSASSLTISGGSGYTTAAVFNYVGFSGLTAGQLAQGNFSGTFVNLSAEL